MYSMWGFWSIGLKETNPPSTPKKLMKMVAERTKQIAEQPFLYKAADFKNTRVAALGNFSIFYKVAEDEIVVTAFWDNRQDPKKLLKILK